MVETNLTHKVLKELEKFLDYLILNEFGAKTRFDDILRVV